MTSATKTFQTNRKAVMTDLQDGLILAAGDELTVRNHDVSYLFRQDSNFLYLTGVEQPGYALLMDPKTKKEVLFIPKVDQRHRVWEGDVPGIPEHKKLYGFRQVYFLEDLPKVYGKMAKGRRKLYTDDLGKKLLKRFKIASKPDRARYEDALEFCRVEKHAGEVALMKKASEASGKGHLAAMAATKPGMYEYEVQAALEAEFLRAGLKHNAYPSIVAGGKNAACLHYRDNHAKLRSGDLLLIDAGAECKGYAADITRTFPVNGKFTAVQRDVYEVVLAAQIACIHGARNGVRNSELHRLSQKIIAAGLKEIGVLTCSPREAIEKGVVGVFYPHGVGHMLGIDVHDVNGGKRHRFTGKRPQNLRNDCVLRPGMVITVEPGIYFIRALIEDKKLRRKFAKQVAWKKADRLLKLGGVRIEDNVVIRQKGPPKNLTRVAKTVKDVEAACAASYP